VIAMPGKNSGGPTLAPTAAFAQVGRDRTSESAAPSPPAPGGQARGPDLPRVEQLIVEATNQFRTQEGRGRLRVDARLARAAREFARHLARTGQLSHTADGRQPWERAAAQGYEECIVAENIGWESNPAGFTTRGRADALVDGWK
jgi:uncharacterized protein YkwD